MTIEYKSRKIERICSDASSAEKQYGLQMAVKISQRIQEITVASSVEEMIRSGLGRCHPLHADRKDQYAMDLVHPYRLVFLIRRNEVEIAKIVEIVDYH